MAKKIEALDWYKKAAESNPENVIFILNYSLALLENKNKEKSKEMFELSKSFYKQKKTDLYNEQEINFIETNFQKLDDKFKKMKI